LPCSRRADGIHTSPTYKLGITAVNRVFVWIVKAHVGRMALLRAGSNM
jgi:hypothetical protein